MNKVDRLTLSKVRIAGIKRRIVQVGDCHLWTGQNHNGAGYVFINGKECSVARVILSIERPVYSNLQVRRTCDTPNCVNPDHLYQVKKPRSKKSA